jgi:TolA-binding protein
MMGKFLQEKAQYTENPSGEIEMIQKKPLVLLLTLSLMGLFSLSAQNRPTSPDELLKTGIIFYGEGKFSEAVTVLRLINPDSKAAGSAEYPEALYWISLAEFSLGEYDKALADLDMLEKTDPRGKRSEEIPYHRGRCLFYLGRHEEALVILKNYADDLDESDVRKAAVYYWMGESLFALGQLDNAADAFSVVIEKYPSSVKYEASSYRLNVINQKKIEAELLAILKWSHEESLKSMEEYQVREKTYDQAIASYQQRLTEILAGEADEGSGAYQNQLTAAAIRIAALEASLDEANAALMELRGSGVSVPTPQKPLTDTERALRILELKAAVLELSNALNKKLGGEE